MIHSLAITHGARIPVLRVGPFLSICHLQGKAVQADRRISLRFLLTSSITLAFGLGLLRVASSFALVGGQDDLALMIGFTAILTIAGSTGALVGCYVLGREDAAGFGACVGLIAAMYWFISISI